VNLHFSHNADIVDFREKYVEVLRDYFQQITDIFAYDIDYVQIEIDEFYDKIKTITVSNECLRTIKTEFELAKLTVFSSIRKCAQTANQTMANLLNDNFYPYINGVQMQQSLMPMETVANMVRSNVLADGKDIIDIMEYSLESSKSWWNNVVLKQVGWETSRFLIEAEMFLENAKECMAYDVIYFMLKVQFLIDDVDRCSEI
jgi:hypothetical protein